MRLAYLCNRYPAVSHSFIRREIQAVERAGHDVFRFSIRPGAHDLKDEADLREAARTEAVIGQGAGRLILAALGMFLLRPLKSLDALGAAFRLSEPGLQSKVRHLAYLIEAAWLAQRFDRLDVDHVHAHFGTNPAAVALLVQALGDRRSALPFMAPTNSMRRLRSRFAPRSMPHPSSRQSAATAEAS